MSSTRNKNTPGNYSAEKQSSQKIHREIMYVHASNGQAIQTNLPGDGLLQGRVAGRDLARNDCDIESFLFGIGSTNLETPQKGPVHPDIIPLHSINVSRKIPMVMPRNLGIEMDQRPMYLN
jgi:hypothetical protein